MVDDMAVYIANLGKYNEGCLVGASPYGLVLTRSGTSTPSFSILLISSHNSVFISTLNG